MHEPTNTNFTLIKEFHAAFNHPLSETPNPALLSDEKLMKLRVDLISEELSEFQDAIKNRDFVEAADAIGDLLYVVYGAAACFGFDADKVFREIHRSNMTKLCTSEQEAIETVNFYHETTTRKVGYSKSSLPGYWVVFDEQSGKILKSKCYTPPDLAPLLE
ncbi:hypothetical protein RCL1_003226 [Eukaryota sp. TZLM3-RCL]